MTKKELRETKDRLDYLYSRANELEREMKEIKDEIFNLESIFNLELDILLK